MQALFTEPSLTLTQCYSTIISSCFDGVARDLPLSGKSSTFPTSVKRRFTHFWTNALDFLSTLAARAYDNFGSFEWFTIETQLQNVLDMYFELMIKKKPLTRKQQLRWKQCIYCAKEHSLPFLMRQARWSCGHLYWSFTVYFLVAQTVCISRQAFWTILLGLFERWANYCTRTLNFYIISYYIRIRLRSE